MDGHHRVRHSDFLQQISQKQQVEVRRQDRSYEKLKKIIKNAPYPEFTRKSLRILQQKQMKEMREEKQRKSIAADTMSQPS